VGRMTNTAKILVCTLVGGVIGGAAGIGVAVAVGLYAQSRSPNDPSAGSAATIIVGTFPMGVLIGMIAGVLCAGRWMKK
jgi:hypothetical protein